MILAGPAAWDSNAIFTGSVTIVNGRPVVVYSGRGPKGGYCTATPANGSDPLYKTWSKTDWADNPVMNGGPSSPNPFASRSLRRALLMPQVIPGHSIAAVRELKCSLWVTAGGKGG